MKDSNELFKQRTLWLIGITVLVKCFFGSVVELDNDEAYYWTYARHLQWNYFDHPPGVAVCIRLFTANLLLHHEFFMRLPAILSSAACTWLIFKIATLLRNERTGWFAACLYTASFYASVVAGLLILPDAPQIFFWLLSVYLLLLVINESTNELRKKWLLMAAGVCIGFCILSKVHGIFIWIGFAGFLFSNRHPLLRNKYLYVSILISVLMVIPSVIWSITNHFSTYNYHSARINFIHFQPLAFLTELAGEIAYFNPVNFCILLGFLFVMKKQARSHTLLMWMSFPLILLVLFFSLFNPTLPHWSGPAYCTLIPLMAIYVSEKMPPKKLSKVVYGAIGLLLVCITLFVAVIKWWPGTLGSKDVEHYGEGDVTLDMNGFRSLADSIKIKSLNGQPSCILTDFWFPGGALDFYVGYPLHIPVKVIGPLNDIHHFAWLNEYAPPLSKGAEAWYITESNFYKPPTAQLQSYFDEVMSPDTVVQYRSGERSRFFLIFKMKGYKGGRLETSLLK